MKFHIVINNQKQWDRIQEMCLNLDILWCSSYKKEEKPYNSSINIIQVYYNIEKEVFEITMQMFESIKVDSIELNEDGFCTFLDVVRESKDVKMSRCPNCGYSVSIIEDKYYNKYVECNNLSCMVRSNNFLSNNSDKCIIKKWNRSVKC
jgi:hypothetical protein